MKIFGDDGFRDIYSKGLMSEKFLGIFFSKLDNFLYLKKISKVIVGYDTRKTSFDIVNLIQRNIKKTKSISILKKPVPTPCLSYLSKIHKKSFLIMITASHFEKDYNGFKFFYGGKKISKKIEKEILSINRLKHTIKQPQILLSDNYKEYTRYINNRFKNHNLKKNILIDFSFGSSALFLKEIKFWRNCKKTNFKFNYDNINEGSGSNNFELNVKKKKIFFDSNYVFTFDGDADRFRVYKKNYGIIETEKIALIFLKYLSRNQSSKKVISTNIVNPSFENYLNNMNISLIKTKVGDRNVTESQKSNSAILGFETSGHFSFNCFMDGIFSCGLFMEIINKNEKIIEEVLKQKFEFKLKLLNYKKDHIRKVKKILFKIKKHSKIIIRKSIWEEKYRVYIFFKKKYSENIKKKLSILQNF